MKKKLLILVSICVVLMALTACGDSSSKIVGDWVCEEKQSKIVFYSDGTCDFDKAVVPGYPYGFGYGSSDYYFLEDNKIKITSFYNEVYTPEYSISGDTLTLDGIVYKKTS